jgi:hypothetical protein
MGLLSPFANGNPVPMLVGIAASAVVAFGLAAVTLRS